MSNSKYLDIRISSNGTVHIDSLGFKGQSCEEIVRRVIGKLGEPSELRKKPEYYEEEERQKEQY